MDRSDRGEVLASLRAMIVPCHLCPRDCGVDRPAGERGVCGTRGDWPALERRPAPVEVTAVRRHGAALDLRLDRGP